jgi:hypothetical protein
MADPVAIADVVMTIEVSMPDPETGECDHRLVIGEEGKNVVVAEGWMLEACQKIMSVAHSTMERLQANIIQREIKMNRAMRKAQANATAEPVQWVGPEPPKPPEVPS